MTFDEWLAIGHEQGWCGPPVCYTHDGTPLSESEETQFFDGYDPCISILRLYNDSGVKAAVELTHSPSVWRASNLGM